MKHCKAFLCFLLISSIFSVSLAAQDGKPNYTLQYKYPFSVGVDYQSLFNLAESADPMTVFDVGTEFQLPLSGFPYLAPQLQAGMTVFDNRNLDEPDKWDNTSIYALLGLDASYRFSKAFEAGAEVYGGYSHALFPDFNPTLGALSNSNLAFGGALRIGLSPFYNFAFEIRPSVRYYTTLGALDRYDGLYVGVGASVHLRLGEDPDKGGAIIRSIRFGEPQVEPLFAAMQSYYVKNPVGSVRITNIEDEPIRDVEVSFFQSGYMDGPTPAVTLDELAPGESITVEFPASFNGAVFETEGITPLTGEIIAVYTSNGRPAEQRKSVTYDLHDKTALTWTDDRKMGAFITPADSSIRDFASAVRLVHKDEVIPALSKELQFAMQAYNALAEMGMIYQPDPSTAFTAVQENTAVVDSISLPRDTLNRITGDCDDLTALFCTVLETVNVETAFVTTPGHIFAGFNTGLAARDYRKVHPERDMTMAVDGELWVLVEITMIGKQDFMQAWTTGMQEYRTYDGQPDKRGFYNTREVQQLFRPVGLKASDRTFGVENEAAVVRAFRSAVDDLAGAILEDYRLAAEESNSSRDYNKYGIMAAQLKQFDAAETAFKKVAELSRNSLSARVNLGSMYFLMERYADAAGVFEDILSELERSGSGRDTVKVKLLINLSKAQYELGQAAEARASYEKAVALDPETTKEYSYLAQVSAGEGRAAEVDTGEAILFVEEE